MAKEDLVQFEGVVQEVLRDARFMVKLENGMDVAAYASGKMRKFRIRILAGSRDARDVAPRSVQGAHLLPSQGRARSAPWILRTQLSESNRLQLSETRLWPGFLSGAVLTASMVRGANGPESDCDVLSGTIAAPCCRSGSGLNCGPNPNLDGRKDQMFRKACRTLRTRSYGGPDPAFRDRPGEAGLVAAGAGRGRCIPGIADRSHPRFPAGRPGR